MRPGSTKMTRGARFRCLSLVPEFGTRLGYRVARTFPVLRRDWSIIWTHLHIGNAMHCDSDRRHSEQIRPRCRVPAVIPSDGGLSSGLCREGYIDVIWDWTKELFSPSSSSRGWAGLSMGRLLDTRSDRGVRGHNPRWTASSGAIETHGSDDAGCR